MSAASAHFQTMCQTLHAHCTKPFLSLESRTRVENKLHCSGEACWWTVHPASKQRSEGEKVWKFTKRWILKLYPKPTKYHIYLFHSYILSANFILSSKKNSFNPLALFVKVRVGDDVIFVSVATERWNKKKQQINIRIHQFDH